MYVVCVRVKVVEGAAEQFIAATEKNARASLNESACHRFDILRDVEDQCRFMIYEVYDNEAGMAAHKETAHYAEWRDTVEPMMAQPREGLKHHAIYPVHACEWESQGNGADKNS